MTAPTPPGGQMMRTNMPCPRCLACLLRLGNPSNVTMSIRASRKIPSIASSEETVAIAADMV